MKKSYTLISPCFFGMEKMLAREIKDLGFEIIKTEDGRITYKTGEDGIAKANMWLRCAERVHLKVAEFEAKTFDELTTKELYEILKSRSQIFTIEQNIHCQDMDDIDYNSLHCYIMDDNKVVAYLRAFSQDDNKYIVRVGRVLTLVHGNGLGKELMQKSIVAIKEKLKCKKICIDAQKHAVGFYKKFGFRVSSDDFLEEGIVHQKMELCTHF